MPSFSLTEQKRWSSRKLLSKAIEFAIKKIEMDRDIGAAWKGHFEEPWPIGKTIGPVKRKKGSWGHP